MKRVWNVLILVILSSKHTCSFESPPRGRLGFLPGGTFALFGGLEKPRRERKKLDKREEYQLRKRLWLERYGSVEALQQTFGVAPPFGDLSPEQTRRLYHTLLPRSLLGLYEMGVMKPEELAPLAYNARIAAKEYARSRCVWTGRLVTTAVDIYRGRFFSKSSSMSWEELYKKYEAQIVEEECNSELNNKTLDEDLTMRIYLRILEKSCSTNQAFDAMFLTDEDDDDSDYLDAVATKLEDDVRYLLLPPKEREKVTKVERKMEKAEEKLAKKESKTETKELRKRQSAVRRNLRQKRRLKTAEVADEEISLHQNVTASNSTASASDDSNAPSKRWTILRILAGTRLKDKKINKEVKS